MFCPHRREPAWRRLIRSRHTVRSIVWFSWQSLLLNRFPHLFNLFKCWLATAISRWARRKRLLCSALLWDHTFSSASLLLASSRFVVFTLFLSCLPPTL